MPVIGSVLIIVFANRGPIHQILCLIPFTFIGKISYSLYMWHWPVIIFCRDWFPHPAIVSLFLIICFSLASYFCIEKPIRSHPRALPPLAAAYGLALCCVLWIALSPGLYDASRFSQVTANIDYYDCRPRLTLSPEFRQIKRGTAFLTRRNRRGDEFVNGGFIENYSNIDHLSPQVVVLGDSHACMWGSTIDSIAKELQVPISFYTMDGVPPFFTDPIAKLSRSELLSSKEQYLYDTKRVEYIKKWNPRLVIFIARWENFSMEDVQPMFSLLQAHAGRILLIEQPPTLTLGNVNVSQYLCYKGAWPTREEQYLPQGDVTSYVKGQLLIESLSKKYSKVKTLQISDIYLRPRNQVLALDGKDVLYFDDDHLSQIGVSKSRPRLNKAIKSLLSE